MGWIERQPAGNVNKNWATCAINNAGTRFIASDGLWSIYLYNGNSWSERAIGGKGNITQVKMNGDGTKYIVAIINEGLFVFDGSNIIEYKPSTLEDQAWYDCGISSDGTKYIAVIFSKRIWVYNGNSWNEYRPLGDNNKAWTCCAINADGTKFIAGCSYYGNGYGTNGIFFYDGISWTDISPAANKEWYSCDISSDGTKCIFTDSKRIWTYDGIVQERRPTGIDENKQWLCVRISGDGAKYLACAYNGRIYSSCDGSIWIEQTPVGDVNKGWKGCDISYDGSKMIVGAYLGGLYTYPANPKFTPIVTMG